MIKLAQSLANTNSEQVPDLQPIVTNSVKYVVYGLEAILLVLILVTFYQYFKLRKQAPVSDDEKNKSQFSKLNSRLVVLIALAIIIFIAYKALTWVVY